MKPPSALLKNWCLAGAVVITLLGFVVHYLYGWSGGNKVVGAVAPVNESVWEHLKMGYWAVVLFSAVEYRYVKRTAHNYFLAKLSGVLALEDAVLLIHYTTTALTGRVVLWVDILSYLVGVVLCQYLTYRFYRLPPQQKRSDGSAVSGLVALGILLIIATYHPPHYQIFRDQNDNTIGINKTPYKVKRYDPSQ